MLVNLSELMHIAETRRIAVGAFNGPTLESAVAALEAAESLRMPLILQHAPVHDMVKSHSPLSSLKRSEFSRRRVSALSRLACGIKYA